MKGIANELRLLCLILTYCGAIKTAQMCAFDLMKGKQMTSCCAWSKSGCVRLVLLLSFNDAAVPEIFLSMVRVHPVTFQKIILLLSPGFPLVRLLPLFLLVSPFLLMHAESVSSMVRLVVLPSLKASDSLKIKNTSFLCLFFQPLVKEKKKLLFGSFVGAAP